MKVSNLTVNCRKFNIKMKLNRLSALFSIVCLAVFSAQAQLTTTNLPIMIVQTPIAINDTFVQGTLNVIDNASMVNNVTDPPTYTGMIGIKTRGNTAYPKISYTLETWSAFNVSTNVSLLGMPTENDWVLMSNYTDRSLMRDVLAKNLHDKMGRYAPRMKHCELIVNGNYAGVYTFGEKIKRDSARLDLANLTVTDNFGENMTGGYIWRLNDGNNPDWVSLIAPPFGTAAQQTKFHYEYPDASDITPAQEAYIKSYVDSFETAMNASNFQDTLVGWRKFGAVNGFADFMIINEVSRNNDAYRNNVFMYKDKSKKMRPGPIWNFDIAWNNTMDCASSKDTGWCYNLGGTCPTESKLAPFWWSKLTTDTSFMKELKCLYTDYRKPGNLLDTAKMFFSIDSISSLLTAQNAVSRNFTQFPIWGVPLVNEPTPMAANYSEEVNNLKQFIRKRITWLDSKWILTTGCPAPLAVNDMELNQLVAVYPNPANNAVSVKYEGKYKKGYTVNILTLQGTRVSQVASSDYITTLDISHLPIGMYLLQVVNEKGSVVRKFIKE
jgi:hypothetical protein